MYQLAIKEFISKGDFRQYNALVNAALAPEHLMIDTCRYHTEKTQPGYLVNADYRDEIFPVLQQMLEKRQSRYRVSFLCIESDFEFFMVGGG